eukprot:g39.t1
MTSGQMQLRPPKPLRQVLRTHLGQSFPKCGGLIFCILPLCVITLLLFIVLSFRNLSPYSERYFVAFDAGSSGSRVFVYRYNPSEPTLSKRLVIATDPVTGELATAKKKPGLSSFAESRDYEGAYRSLSELLQYAQSVVPSSLYEQTSLVILGTAGLRMVDEESRNNLFDFVTSKIQNDFKFHFQRNDIRVISGVEEGAFAWIATNFIEDTLVSPDLPTIGSVDLGGGSMQITFELKDGEYADTANTLEVLGRRIYSSSFLGYGSNKVRERYLLASIIPEEQRARVLDVTWENGISSEPEIDDPCLPLGYKARFKMLEKKSSSGSHHHHSGSYHRVPVILEDNFEPPFQLSENENSKDNDKTFIVKGKGDWRKCVHKMRPLLSKDSICLKSSNCGINGIYLPDVTGDSVSAFSEKKPSEQKSFRHAWYGFSEYYYTLNDLWEMSNQVYDPERIEGKSLKYCKQPWHEMYKTWKNQKEKLGISKSRIVNQCYKVAWMALTLEGLNFGTAEPSMLSISEQFKLNGQGKFPVSIFPRDPDGVSWTLGAVVHAHPLTVLANSGAGMSTETLLDITKGFRGGKLPSQ